jgi:hypothetical protein
MTSEIEQKMKELITVFENQLSPLKYDSQIPPVAQTYLNPLKYRANQNYPGPTLKYLMIQEGDLIIVYHQVKGGKTFIGYNTRTKLGGRFPDNIVNLVETMSRTDQKPVVCIGSRAIFTLPDDLICHSGDYIRACRFTQDGKTGYGLNQRTLEWGNYPVSLTRVVEFDS